jgi:hypothetical protein
MPPIAVISATNPLRESERCGVMTAENMGASAAAALSASIRRNIRRKWQKR